MKKTRIIMPVAVLCILVAVILTFNNTLSYLTDYDRKVNIVTIGKVDIMIDEGEYNEESSYNVETGSDLPKAPKIKNEGTEDAFVFFKISVPKKDVTLLYEKTFIVGEGQDEVTYKEGTPTSDNRDANGNPQKNVDEIYKMLANGSNIGNLAADSVFEAADKPNTEPQLIFEYHKGNLSDENNKIAGWVFLKREIGQGDDKYNHYYFGYNKRVLKKTADSNDDETITLFDHIQLKSFIDEELMAGHNDNDVEVSLLVKAYGIQAESLGVPGISDDADYLSDDQLKRVFGIVERKQVM